MGHGIPAAPAEPVEIGVQSGQMKNCGFRYALVIAALVFGQSLAIAHDYQHPLLADAEVVCQDCAHGHQLQAGPSASQALASQPHSDEVPQALPIAPALARRHSPTAIRAPPHRHV